MAAGSESEGNLSVSQVLAFTAALLALMTYYRFADQIHIAQRVLNPCRAPRVHLGLKIKIDARTSRRRRETDRDFSFARLQSAGYAVDVVNGGAAAIDGCIRPIRFDRARSGLPDVDWLQVLQKIKNAKRFAGAHFERARFGGRSVSGLEQGADDYLVKPFALWSYWRGRACAGRGQPTPEKLQVGELALDCIRRKVTRNNEIIELAPRIQHSGIYDADRGRPLSRTMIVEHVWDMDYDGLTNIVGRLHPPFAE